MASMRDIKRRKESIQSTGQITKAMKLVSTVKLQKAKTRAENSKPYFDQMYSAVSAMLRKSTNLSHPYLTAGKSDKKAVIVISSNRGLAGGYNANVIKLVSGGNFDKKKTQVYAVGRKAKEGLARRGYQIAIDYSEVMNAPIYKDAVMIGKEVLEAFAKDEVGEIYLAYTVFKNTVTHVPTIIKLLPINTEVMKEEEEFEDANERLTLMNYEPEAEEALDVIIPKYMNSLIYGALVQAVASENGARMQAMDSATNNAEDMISDLSLKYNRARQSSITQELTEIIAGANAID
jgi:F-type H+-transporting ATPase subunit gamma